MQRETTAVRSSEELDTHAIEAFLQTELSGKVENLRISQFPAGSSNLTYLIEFGGNEYVLRRPPFGNTVRTAHDMRREFDTLKKLNTVFPRAPRPLAFCGDESVIGSEFYLMERRKGIIIRGTAPKEIEGSREKQIRVAKMFIHCLSDLHSIDVESAGLSDLGKPDGYAKRQVEGWTKRYYAARTHDLPKLEASIDWLNANIPTESGSAIIHNDYKFDNVMLDPEDFTKITAVLDWEMVTIGDPLMDLGTTLGYWMSRNAGSELLNMPFNPRILMENISRRDLVEMYSEAIGRELPDMLFYYVFGTFKIAVIAQQIYARFVKGFTKDPRFAGFDRFVAALGRIAANALETGSI